MAVVPTLAIGPVIFAPAQFTVRGGHVGYAGLGGRPEQLAAQALAALEAPLVPAPHVKHVVGRKPAAHPVTIVVLCTVAVAPGALFDALGLVEVCHDPSCL